MECLCGLVVPINWQINERASQRDQHAAKVAMCADATLMIVDFIDRGLSIPEWLPPGGQLQNADHWPSGLSGKLQKASLGPKSKQQLDPAHSLGMGHPFQSYSGKDKLYSGMGYDLSFLHSRLQFLESVLSLNLVVVSKKIFWHLIATCSSVKSYKVSLSNITDLYFV